MKTYATHPAEFDHEAWTTVTKVLGWQRAIALVDVPGYRGIFVIVFTVAWILPPPARPVVRTIARALVDRPRSRKRLLKLGRLVERFV